MANSLTVVIPTAGRPDLLNRTLTSLAACTQPDIYRETIVVENGPKSGAEDIVSTHRLALNARYVYVAQGNKSYALNTVLDMVKECLIFFIDDDVRLHPQILRFYSDAAAEFKEGYFFGGPVGVDYEKEPPTWLKEYLPPSAAGWIYDQDYLPTDKGWPRFLGSNWAAFSRDIKTCGGFDPNYGPGSPTGSTGQETNMQNRLIGNGLKGRYVSSAIVWHYVPKTRCSPKWALSRAYRKGVELGTQGEPQMLDFIGFPRWMIKELLKKAWRSARYSLPNHKSEVRFNAYYELYYYLGFINGIKKISN